MRCVNFYRLLPFDEAFERGKRLHGTHAVWRSRPLWIHSIRKLLFLHSFMRCRVEVFDFSILAAIAKYDLKSMILGRNDYIPGLHSRMCRTIRKFKTKKFSWLSSFYDRTQWPEHPSCACCRYARKSIWIGSDFSSITGAFEISTYFGAVTEASTYVCFAMPRKLVPIQSYT